MMRSEERDKDKRHHNEPTCNKKKLNDKKNMSSEVNSKCTRSDHQSKTQEVSNYRKDEKQKVRLASGIVQKSSEKNRHQDRIGRQDRTYRNSPVELTNRGCRKTDNSSSSSSSSSSEENDDENVNQKKGSRLHLGKRNNLEESFKELSDRKKRIESELRALDAEEAAQAEKKKTAKNHSNYRRHQHHQGKERKHVEEKTVRIKREPMSDDNGTNIHKRTQREKQVVRVKREPASDDERRSSRPHKFPRRDQPVQVKQERSHSASGHSRNHHSSDSHRRHNTNAASRSDTADNMEWGRSEQEKSDKKEVKEKEKPNFETSGKLAEDTNTFNGVVIKYNEPSEARKPRRKWRLYPFKGETSLPFIPVHRQSAYLLGRSRLIADIPIDHPSCSKQHAVLQFRLTPYTRENGTKGRNVRPYVIDLDSSNGTYVNNNKIEPRRYTELFEKDVLKFGYSSRVYVILHEDSKNEDENDDEED